MGLHPFLTHLVATLSVYEVGPPTAPVPIYNGPSDWYTDTILRSLSAMARRMYTAEEAWNAIKASEKCGSSSKKRRSVGDSPPLSSASSSTLSESEILSPSDGLALNNADTTGVSYFYPPSSSSLDCVADTKAASNKEETDDFEMLSYDNETSSLHKRATARSASPMRIPIDGMPNHKLHDGDGADWAPPQPPEAQAHTFCPACGRTLSEFSQMALSSPMIIPPNGALAAAAFESGISAVEELRLLKAQVQDVARVCGAVACGDLSQKITVPVHGDVMVKLKEVINSMVSSCVNRPSTPIIKHNCRQVEKLGQFASEVTRVSTEVGTEGYVQTPITHTFKLNIVIVNSAVKH